MKKILIQISLILGTLLSFSLNAAPIKSIEILGLSAISRGTVLSYLPVEVGDEYNKQVSTQIIRSLYKTRFFKDIEVSQDDQILKIKLQENPHIKYVDVINYSDKVIDEDSLKQILKSMEISQGKIFNKRQLDKLISQLKGTYISKGYYSIKITKTIEIDAQNRIGIELDIDEGDVARIISMKITGAKINEEEDLLDLFEIGKADFFIINYFTEKDHYSKVALDAGIEAMKSFYINSGYLDFKIDKIKTELSEDKESISVNIHISEGAEYKIGNVQFSGDLLNQSVQDLEDLLTVSKGDVFKRKKVIESIQAITDVFADQGYAFAKVDPVTSENKKTHTINLNIKVSLNKKVYINRITIIGNTRTQDEVIRREIGINEGGLYSNTELDEAIKKIKRLGFFSDVKMEVSKIKSFEDKINLHFSVEETKTGTFSIGLSHSNSSGAAFNMGIKENNFLGTGNTLNAALSTSKAVQEMSFYFSDPYFTEDKHSISYGIFTKTIDGANLDVSSYKIDEKGASLGYGIPITENTRINADVKASTRDITCGTTFAGSGYEPTQCASNDKTEVKINLNWSLNSLDAYNNPTEGQRTRLSTDIALPIADFRYVKFDFSHDSYHPLPNDLVFKVNGDIGLARGYSNKELPFFKRYYSGGSSSVRGFDFNSLGVTYANGKAKGGEVSLLAGASIISPMKFIKDSDNMRMSAFIDAGGVNEKISTLTLDEIRASAGVAFSWMTPLGPLGIYAAKPLIQKSSDKTKTFEFTIGTSF
ncbi:MAG: outer membrane protein assembly factor BamA [Candidatus Thioglobus sp.]|jgi:outer membrane protein insertion porin family|nr:outer membrane protein assembly factor BamA [Candidatus Thioglobus sp.]MBT3745374.1 outer membrane protein assembly factor BamA [Candidatus Thioglobus sp.]MBT5291762.1 outer membrane protein assembly factor BamA [Thiotrichales bacterium]MBT6752103.1 outer membrane protein assembly factor BamA [Candidatus Thioglobus sp.]